MAKEKAKSAMDMATDALAKPEKAKRSKKSIHMMIEPTDNKGFIVKHEEHADGMPTGKRKHHVFSDASALHKHVVKTYPAKQAAEPEPEPAAEVANEQAAEPAGAAPTEG